MGRIISRTKRTGDQPARRKIEGMKYLIALLAVAGIFVSSRALQIHYMDPAQAPPCAVTEKWDCGTVNHGKYSVFPPKTDDEFDDNTGQYHANKPHIPVALIGIVGYTLIGILALLGWMWTVLELARIGFFCAAFLSYIEAFIISKWCIYCLWSQCIITAILVASVVAVVTQRRRRTASPVAVPVEIGE